MNNHLTNDISYHQLEAIKLPLVNKFYQSVNARGKASGGDIVWVVRDGHSIVGAARLTPVKNQYWLLTGVYISANYRGQGIASKLLSQLIATEPVCYTFSLSHLAEFYAKLGFYQVSSQQLPCELAQRFKAYQQQGRSIIAMIKE